MTKFIGLIKSFNKITTVPPSPLADIICKSLSMRLIQKTIVYFFFKDFETNLSQNVHN